MTTATPMIWTTTTTINEIANAVRDAGSVVLLTHAKPDGDALGSTAALAKAINLQSGTSGASSKAECWYTGPMPHWHKSIMAPTTHRHVEPGNEIAFALEPELILVCDTGSWSQLDVYADWVRARPERTIVIDHHLHGDADMSPRRLLDTEAAAVCQTASDLASAILGVEPSAFPVDIATACYVGIATDTGWFRHGNVDARVMRNAADLLQAGARHEWLHQLTEMDDRPQRLKLMGAALASLEYHQDGKVATLCLTKADFERTGSAPGDSGGFVDLARTVGAVRVSALLTEVEPHAGDGPHTKVSLRSKGGDDAVDVNKVAMQFGGGGHARAAGVRFKLPIAEAKAKLLEALS